MEDEEIWLNALTSRNTIVHLYSEDEADRVCAQLPAYLRSLKNCLLNLKTTSANEALGNSLFQNRVKIKKGRSVKMKRIFFVVATVFGIRIFAHGSVKDLDAGVDFIFAQIAQDSKLAGKSIAVPPFLTFEDKTTALGKLLSEKLIIKFAESKKAVPVERDFIFKLIDEMKLGMTGLIEPKTVQQIGKFSSAIYVLMGSLQRVGNEIQVHSRLVKTETGEIENASEVAIAATLEINELLASEAGATAPVSPTKVTKNVTIDIEKLRANYSNLQDELEKLKRQLAIASTRNDRVELEEKKIGTERLLNVNEYVAKGSIAYRIGNYNSALGNYNNAIELEPNHAAAYSQRGLIYEKMGKFDLANADFNKSILLSPASADFYVNRGVFYGKRGSNSRAIVDFDKAIELNPVDSFAFYNRGLAKSNNRMNEDAIEDLNSSIRFNDEYVPAYYNRGCIYMEMKKCSEAISDFNRVVESDPLAVDALLNRGSCHHIVGDYDAAIFDYSKALELDNKNAQAYFNRGLSYVNANQKSAGMRDIQKSCELGVNQACNTLDRLRVGKFSHNP